MLDDLLNTKKRKDVYSKRDRERILESGVSDLFKEDKNKCNYNEVCCVHCQHEKIKFIYDWDHIYIEDINDYLEEIKDEEKFNLTFSDLLQFKMTFFFI